MRHLAPAQCSTSVLWELASHCCGQIVPTAQASPASAAATLSMSVEPPPGWSLPGSEGRACTIRHPGETPAARPALPRPVCPGWLAVTAGRLPPVPQAANASTTINPVSQTGTRRTNLERLAFNSGSVAGPAATRYR